MAEFQAGDRIVVEQDVEFFNFEIMDYCGVPSRRIMKIDDIIDISENIEMFIPCDYDLRYRSEKQKSGKVRAAEKFVGVLQKLHGTTKMARCGTYGFFVTEIQRCKDIAKPIKSVFVPGKQGKFLSGIDVKTIPDEKVIQCQIGDTFLITNYWPKKFHHTTVAEIQHNGSKYIVHCSNLQDKVEIY